MINEKDVIEAISEAEKVMAFLERCGCPDEAEAIMKVCSLLFAFSAPHFIGAMFVDGKPVFKN
jgi:hypothetical protein